MGILVGMKDICMYLKKSEATVLDMIRYYGLPAKKITGGTWESDTELIDRWRRELITATGDNPAAIPTPAKRSKRRADRHRGAG